VHASTDAAIGFDGVCEILEAVRGPLIASIRRFQLGESGDGEQLLSKAAKAGDPEYLDAARLFVGEEQQHAALLLRLLGYLGGEPMRKHWSDAVFVRLRRLMGLRTELMVLTVAEVVALSYYGGLAADGPDPVVRAVAARIVADEHPHVRFQQDRLRGRVRPVRCPGAADGLRVLVANCDWRDGRGRAGSRSPTGRDRLSAYPIRPRRAGRLREGLRHRSPPAGHSFVGRHHLFVDDLRRCMSRAEVCDGHRTV
jgi:hypothetical protein